MTSKELREKRAKLAAELRSIVEKGTLTAEDKAQFDKIDADQKAVYEDLRRVEALETIEGELKEVRSVGIGRENRTVTIEAKPDQRQLEAWRSYLVNGVNDMPSDLLSELRALTLSGTSGYTAPPIPNSQYIELLRNFSDIRQAPITVVPTATGNTIPFPVLDDTSNTASGPTAENTDVGSASDPSINQINLSAYMVTSGVLKTSRQFLRDSIIPAEQWLNEKVAERIAVKQNGLFTTGTGSSQPQGIVTGAASGVALSTGHASALGVGSSGTDYVGAAKDLISNLYGLVGSVYKRYQVAGKTGFMMNFNTLLNLQKYVDGQGRQLIQPTVSASIAEGPAYTLLGYPIWINSDIADIGASAKPILFGNFSNFYVRDVGTIAVDRLDERYAEYLVVGFNGYHAVDSKVMNSNAIKYLQMSAT